MDLHRPRREATAGGGHDCSRARLVRTQVQDALRSARPRPGDDGEQTCEDTQNSDKAATREHIHPFMHRAQKNRTVVLFFELMRRALPPKLAFTFSLPFLVP